MWLLFKGYKNAEQTKNTLNEPKINSNLLKAADQYLVDGLKTLCIGHLESNLTLENALDIMIVAFQINQSGLFDSAIQYIWENKGNLIGTESWNEIVPPSLYFFPLFLV